MATTLDARYEAHKAKTEAFVNTVKEADRGFTSDEQTEFDAMIAEGKDLYAAAGGLTAAETALAEMQNRSIDPTPVAAGSLGEQFVNSGQWSSFKANYPNGVPAGATVSSGAVRLGISNALLTDPGLAPATHVLDVPGNIDSYELMNAITVFNGAEQTIKTFTASFTNAAAVVAEGAAKPESTLTWTPLTVNQAVVAHHIPVTNQALNHNATMRNTIDNFMVNGVRSKVQNVIASDIAGWTGLGTQAFATDLRTTIRKAVTTAQVQGAILGSGPVSIALSATDAEGLDLELLASVQLAPGQAPQQAQNIWRSNVIVVPPMASGFAYVGDLKQVIWHTSGGIDVSVGMVNTQFTENERTILAETEGVTTVMNAGALVKAAMTV